MKSRGGKVWLVSGASEARRKTAIDKIVKSNRGREVFVGRLGKQEPKHWKHTMLADIRDQAGLDRISKKTVVLVVDAPPVTMTAIPELRWVNTDTNETTINPSASIDGIVSGLRDNPHNTTVAGFFTFSPNRITESNAGFDNVAWTDVHGDPMSVLPHLAKATSASQFTAKARKEIARDAEQREDSGNGINAFDWLYIWYRGRVFYTHDANLIGSVQAADQAIRDGGRFRPLDGAPRANRFVYLPSEKPLPGARGSDGSSGLKTLVLLAAAGVGAAVVIKKAST